MARKRRTDRNHLVYQLTNKITGERYIGITVMRGQAKLKSLKMRWEGHLYKAFVEQKDWTLSQNIREYGERAFHKEIVDVVRGKLEAHKREVELIDAINPELNTKKKSEICC